MKIYGIEIKGHQMYGNSSLFMIHIMKGSALYSGYRHNLSCNFACMGFGYSLQIYWKNIR